MVVAHKGSDVFWRRRKTREIKRDSPQECLLGRACSGMKRSSGLPLQNECIDWRPHPLGIFNGRHCWPDERLKGPVLGSIGHARIGLVGTRWPGCSLIDPGPDRCHLLSAQSHALRRHDGVWIGCFNTIDKQARCAHTQHNRLAGIAAGECTSACGKRQPSFIFFWAMTLKAVAFEQRLDVAGKVDLHSRAPG